MYVGFVVASFAASDLKDEQNFSRTKGSDAEAERWDAAWWSPGVRGVGQEGMGGVEDRGREQVTKGLGPHGPGFWSQGLGPDFIGKGELAKPQAFTEYLHHTRFTYCFARVLFQAQQS